MGGGIPVGAPLTDPGSTRGDHLAGAEVDAFPKDLRRPQPLGPCPARRVGRGPDARCKQTVGRWSMAANAQPHGGVVAVVSGGIAVGVWIGAAMPGMLRDFPHELVAD